MKKLKLNLEGAKVLNRAQQRSINGGSGDSTLATCSVTCNHNTVSCKGKNCQSNPRLGFCSAEDENGKTIKNYC